MKQIVSKKLLFARKKTEQLILSFSYYGVTLHESVVSGIEVPVLLDITILLASLHDDERILFVFGGAEFSIVVLPVSV